jgi:hypothetical protein
VLQKFISWAESIVANKTPEFLEASVTISEPSGNRSARLDIDTKNEVARITFWESGDYCAEILDVESESNTYIENGLLRSGESLPEKLRPFFKILSDPKVGK